MGEPRKVPSDCLAILGVRLAKTVTRSFTLAAAKQQIPTSQGVVVHNQQSVLHSPEEEDLKKDNRLHVEYSTVGETLKILTWMQS